MTSFRRIRVKCELLAEQAIADASKIIFDEGGVPELLEFLAVMAHGQVLPSPVILRLRHEARRIISKNGGTPKRKRRSA